MKEKLQMKHFGKVIKLFAPNNWQHYSRKTSCITKYQNAKSNYDRIYNWNTTTINKLKAYLISHGLETSISSERVDFFMHYILAIYMRAYELPDKDDKNILIHYPYFIHQHLTHSDIIDLPPSRWIGEHAVSFKDMAIFFTLFSEVSNCYAERYKKYLDEETSSKRRYKRIPEQNYELSHKQKEQLQKLTELAKQMYTAPKEEISLAPDITLSKLFEELIAVFFPKN